MIRYPIRPSTWRNRVAAASRDWLDTAATRTARFRVLGEYDEEGKSAIWSKIKRVYMELQGYKCGFCERRLEKSQFGNIEHDVEHFRPKKSVKVWPTSKQRRDRSITVDQELNLSLGGAADPGYFWLAYHIENYLISCKTCNSTLKSNSFPVARNRRQVNEGTDSPRQLKNEKPYLIYPIGAVDTDPERLIKFEGIVPVPVATRGHSHARARVTIDFFELDTREVLLEERAETILALHVALASTNDPNDDTAGAAQLLVDRLTSDAAPHANCARCHRTLAATDPDRANEYAAAAIAMLRGLSGG
ncbi:MAG: hypothetical protein QNI99_11530 [Woeseiaceae bacterium]|nr:hypothetical protein [Woeseiaceae bacterium]